MISKNCNNYLKRKKNAARSNFGMCKLRSYNSHCFFKLCLKYCIEHTIKMSGTGDGKVKVHQVSTNNGGTHYLVDDIVCLSKTSIVRF